MRDRQNPDMLVPPATDRGTLPNLRFAFSDAHMRLEPGGWARQITARELGVSKQVTGVSGQARMGMFASSRDARTFDFMAGDVGFVPFATGYYIENTGNETFRSLEVFKSDHYADVLPQQWMALTPPALLQAHLKLSDETLAHLRREKAPIVPV